MKIEVIEILLVCVIVSIQIYVFARTFKQIRVFKNIIPNVDSLIVSKVFVPVTDLQRLSPKEILANISNYKNNQVIEPTYIPAGDFGDSESTDLFFEEAQQNNHVEKTEVNIIESDASRNEVFDKMFFSVNNYLIRNRGAASDFNLIKDIVERNTSAVEEDINLTVSIPLYLGLMATMIGIVLALFNMSSIGLSTQDSTLTSDLDRGIAILIGGVKIAMIASFVGLMLTIINSGWVFKGSRKYSEARKNDLYTFIQIELLPLINQGLASTLESLQRNLLKFNNEFSTNLGGLTGIFDSSRSAIKEQKKLLDALDKAKISEITRYNIDVLKQLNVSIEKFEQFNACFTNVTLFVENSQSIVSKTNELLARTDNFKSIADNLENRLNQSHLLMQFLSEHFNKLNEHKEFTSNAVADVGHSISETFKELKEHIQNSSESVKQFTVDETELLKTALSESKTNLGNLEYLATLKSDVSQFKNSSALQGESLKQAIDDLNRNAARSIAILEQIEEHSVTNKKISVITSIKNFLKTKK